MATAALYKEIPGSPGLPLLGSSLDIFRDFDQVVKQRYARYGEVHWFNMFGRRFIALLGPDANQLVFQNRGDVFENEAWNFLIGPFFRRGLMLLDFDEHRMHRRIMQGAFHRDALAGYLKVMNPRLAHDLAQWPQDSQGGDFRVFEALKAMTLNVASEVFVGHPPGPEASKVNAAFLDLVRAGTDIIRFPLPGTRWRRGIRSRAFMEEFFAREIPHKRTADEPDLFSKLCHARTEDGVPFTDDDVINHIIFLMMAAHDTSTITLTNMIYHLALNQDWQERLRENSRALGKAQLDFEDLNSMTEMTWTMKEALRLCAPVPSMPRRTVKPVEFKGFEIPAGHMIMLSPWFAHKMPEYWTEPETFDPERFAPGREEDKQHPFLWTPFGGGAHKCIGMHFGEMEIKAAMHQLLLRFRWSVPDNYRIRYDFKSLPIPKDRLPIRIERIGA